MKKEGALIASFGPVIAGSLLGRDDASLCMCHQPLRRKMLPSSSPSLTLRLLMSYIYGAPSKARNANVVYIWTYVWQR